MSGHSKWSTIKHQKEATDAVRGKIFTKLANAIIIAVKQGEGSDPQSNFKLRLMIEKARELNMPKDNIERAIERAKGKIEGAGITEAIYEAFGPGGVGIIIETASDNKQRTVAELKNILERGGGVLATTGAVSHFFQLVGLITVTPVTKSSDQIMQAALDTGAIDLEESPNLVEIYTNPKDLHEIKMTMEKKGIPVSSFELFYRPTTTVPINDSQTASSILKLLSSLEEMEDVQKVFANFEIPDEYLK
jgi:YebC/PmpR family DNA-binding regulatory protein